ncbi:MAG: hypothetical protein GXP19_01055 [Gammaproteobacteria bacterium]|nr:hypothetical protein [Gammaproteobacteria bacterium]
MSKRFQVAASPLNGVKFDLAIILVISVLLLVTVDKLLTNFFGQFLFLAGYGVVAMIWLVTKARRVVTAHQNNDL